MAIGIGGGIAISLLLLSPKTPANPHVTVTNFYTVSNMMPIFVDVDPSTVADPCKALALKYNNLNATYRMLSMADPKYLSNASPSCIDFSLSSNVYRMCYKVDVPVNPFRWRVLGGFNTSIPVNLTYMLGGGVQLFEHIDIVGGVMSTASLNNIGVWVLGGYTF